MIININGTDVACGLDWFKTFFGFMSLCLAILAAFIGTIFMDTDLSCPCGHYNEDECKAFGCPCQKGE